MCNDNCAGRVAKEEIQASKGRPSYIPAFAAEDIGPAIRLPSCCLEVTCRGAGQTIDELLLSVDLTFASSYKYRACSESNVLMRSARDQGGRR